MYSPTDFLERAFTRYNETVLRNRMRGAQGDADTADRELYRIAKSVFGRVQEACASSVGWPLPGTWPAGSTDDDGTTSIAGTAYSERWPDNLLQRALDLFNWRTVAGLDEASDNQRKVGQDAEKWFTDLENGNVALGLAGDGASENGTGEPVAARERNGDSNVTGACDKPNLLDDFRRGGWDRYGWGGY